MVDVHIFSGTEVSLGAAIIARTSRLTGQGHSFALSCDLAMKESFYSRCSPGPDDIGDSQTLQSLSVPDIPEDPPPLSQVGDRPGKAFSESSNLSEFLLTGLLRRGDTPTFVFSFLLACAQKN